jgi:hypothetical protein
MASQDELFDDEPSAETTEDLEDRSTISPVRRYVGRIGVLLAPASGPSPAETFERVESALRKDARVVRVASADDVSTPYPIDAYPYAMGPNDPDLLTGNDAFRGFQVTPLRFEVSVPIKNQPKRFGKSATADRYFAAWDGCVLVVIWEVPVGKAPDIRLAGGQVIIEILSDALDSVGSYAYVQSCSAGCDLGFLHTDVVVDVYANSPDPVRFLRTKRWGRQLARTGEMASGDLLDYVDELHWEVRSPTLNYAEAKNIGARVQDLEAAARTTASELLNLEYNRAARATLGVWQRLKHFVRHSSAEEKTARSLVYELSRHLNNAESLNRIWLTKDGEFEDSAAEHNAARLFEIDYKRDRRALASMNLSGLSAIASTTSERLDNRRVATLTTASAIGGGLLVVIAERLL